MLLSRAALHSPEKKAPSRADGNELPQSGKGERPSTLPKGTATSSRSLWGRRRNPLRAPSIPGAKPASPSPLIPWAELEGS